MLLAIFINGNNLNFCTAKGKDNRFVSKSVPGSRPSGEKDPISYALAFAVGALLGFLLRKYPEKKSIEEPTYNREENALQAFLDFVKIFGDLGKEPKDKMISVEFHTVIFNYAVKVYEFLLGNNFGEASIESVRNLLLGYPEEKFKLKGATQSVIDLIF
jgi:hypothetical protein